MDCNFVMTVQGKFVEVQGSGEEATFSEDELKTLTELAKKGISEIAAMQAGFLMKHLLGAG